MACNFDGKQSVGKRFAGIFAAGILGILCSPLVTAAPWGPAPAMPAEAFDCGMLLSHNGVGGVAGRFVMLGDPNAAGTPDLPRNDICAGSVDPATGMWNPNSGRFYCGGRNGCQIPQINRGEASPTVKDSAYYGYQLILAKYASVADVILADPPGGLLILPGGGVAGPALQQGGLQPGDLPARPGFPAINGAGPDVTVNKNSTLSLRPGNYGNLFISGKSTLILAPDPAAGDTEPYIYDFKRITSAVGGRIEVLLENTDLRVKEFITFQHVFSVNPGNTPRFYIYVEGVSGDSTYGGANANPAGIQVIDPATPWTDQQWIDELVDPSAPPAVFFNRGDSTFNACLLYIKNGTAVLGGNEIYTTQLISQNFRSLRFNVSLQQPLLTDCQREARVDCGALGRRSSTPPNGPPITVAGALSCDVDQQLSIKGWNLSLENPWTVYKLRFFPKAVGIPANGRDAADSANACYELVVDPADLANSPLEIIPDGLPNENILRTSLVQEPNFITDLYTNCQVAGLAEVYAVLVSPESAVTGEPVCYSNVTEWLLTAANGDTKCTLVDPIP